MSHVNTADPAGDMMDDDWDAPLTLDVACERFFDGAITKAALRAEARRGNLVITRIGRRDFVTLRALKEMMTRCRVVPNGHASASTQQSALTSSETDRESIALAAALMSSRALRQNSRRK